MHSYRCSKATCVNLEASGMCSVAVALVGRSSWPVARAAAAAKREAGRNKQYVPLRRISSVRQIKCSARRVDCAARRGRLPRKSVCLARKAAAAAAAAYLMLHLLSMLRTIAGESCERAACAASKLPCRVSSFYALFALRESNRSTSSARLSSAQAPPPEDALQNRLLVLALQRRRIH